MTDDFYADVPVIATWRECRNVRGGWRALREDGSPVFVRQRGRTARVPDRDRLLITDGVTVTGTISLERARRSSRRAEGN
jgi:hypothetical protein